MIHQFENPIPVITPLGKGYLFYVKDNGMFENDEFCVVLESGELRHFTTKQIKIEKNYTYEINANSDHIPIS